MRTEVRTRRIESALTRSPDTLRLDAEYSDYRGGVDRPMTLPAIAAGSVTVL